MIDRFFDFFQEKFGKTTRYLVQETRRANELQADEIAADTELMLPPVPVRGYTDYNYPEPRPQIRTYRPESQGYAFTTSFAEVTFSDEPRVGPVAELEPERAGKLTVIEVDLTGLSPEQARSIRERGPSDAYLILPKSGFATLQLLEQASTCNDAGEWLRDSPYMPLLRKKLASYTPEKKRELAAKAKAMPLIIVDWGLDPASPGHGSKVLSVAQYLLHSLGDVGFLADSIEQMDLYPGNQYQRDQLLKLLKEYHSHLSGDRGFFRRDPLAGVFREAEDWVRNVRLDPAGNQYEVPEILIKAAFWKLAERRAWVNMSFTLYSPTFKVEDPNFVRENRSFASLAAGNSRLPLPPGTAPQEAGSHSLNLVNVTHGDLRGSIAGTFSDLERNTVVSLVGPGCGYAFGTLTPTESGSSFASPYVAAAAWLKHLLDGTEVKGMRRNLILASRLLPSLEQPIESAGVFDAARLLGYPGPHFVDVHNNVVRLREGTVEFHGEDETGQPRRGGGRVQKDAPRTLVIYQHDSSFWFLLREVGTSGFPHVQASRGRLRRLSVTLTQENGERLEIRTPKEFFDQIHELSF